MIQHELLRAAECTSGNLRVHGVSCFITNEFSPWLYLPITTQNYVKQDLTGSSGFFGKKYLLDDIVVIDVHGL